MLKGLLEGFLFIARVAFIASFVSLTLVILTI